MTSYIPISILKSLNNLTAIKFGTNNQGPSRINANSFIGDLLVSSGQNF